MAKELFHFPAVGNLFSTMVHAGMLQIFMVVMAIAERCTRAVPSVQEYPVKKIHVLRRVPATCSNWDKAWSWLTKVDCGTKYRMELVTEPPREIRQYKLQYVCCDGDTECKEANNIQTSWFDTTDEKFLAVVLGSTAACVVIVIIIFAITFYTKKTRCHTMCDQESHVYASADGEEVPEVHRDDKRQQQQSEEVENEVEQKGSDAEYAEICDGRNPRYTAIFKENLENKEDPFNKASAPPIYTGPGSKTYVNSACRVSAPFSSVNEHQIARLTLTPFSEDAVSCERSHHLQHGVNCHVAHAGDDTETRYYNVREKKKKRRRSSGSQCDVSGTNSSGRNANLSVSMEMIVRSSSASEALGKMSEASMKKTNRLSAPPGSLDVPDETIGSPSSAVIRSSSNNKFSIVRETALTSLCPSDKIHTTKLSRDSIEQKHVRKTSRGSDSSPHRLQTRMSSSHSGDLSDMRSAARSVSPSKGATATCCDSTHARTLENCADAAQASENDSLLRYPTCHSGCGDDRAFEDCEHCAKYDRLDYQSDSDVASLHIYQCLEDVRRECAELRAASLATQANTSVKNACIVSEDDPNKVPSKCQVLGSVTQC